MVALSICQIFYIIILSAWFDFTCIEYTQYDTLLIQSMKLWTEEDRSFWNIDKTKKRFWWKS